VDNILSHVASCYNPPMNEKTPDEVGKFESIFWIDVDKIKPNPYQPRREFDDAQLRALGESIRQYGVLQPIVVTRREIEHEHGGISTEYELIAGERRLRASKLIGVPQIPAVIRGGDNDRKVKLELAIIENLQREDLNAIDRAKAFKQLVEEFHVPTAEAAQKIGVTRVYMANTIRLLNLPEHIQQAVVDGQITEGHARGLLMLSDKPEEQDALFRDVVTRRITVRDVENIARSVAKHKVRKHKLSPEEEDLEKKLSEHFGTRVRIRQKAKGGEVVIDYFSDEDLTHIAKVLVFTDAKPSPQEEEPLPLVPGEMTQKEAEDLYDIKNFSL
jgi:ParB family chromosome partitioning protein